MVTAANAWSNRRRLIAFLIIATLATLVIFTVSPELMVRRQYEETTGGGAKEKMSRTSTESVPSYPWFGAPTTVESGAGSPSERRHSSSPHHGQASKPKRNQIRTESAICQQDQDGSVGS